MSHEKWMHRASVIHNCWEVVPSCTKCKKYLCNHLHSFHHSVKSTNVSSETSVWATRRQYCMGREAVLDQYRVQTTYYSWSHNCCYWLIAWQAVEWILGSGIIYCTFALMCFVNMLGCISIAGLIRSCGGSIMKKTVTVF